MSLSVTLLVLLAAFFHALWNAFVKKGSDPLISVAGVALASSSIAACLIPFVGLPEPALWPWLAVSLIVHTLYMVMLSQAYRYGDFTIAYPIARGLAPALVTVYSLLFMQAELEGAQLIGLLGILSGILLFATRRLGLVIADRRALGYATLTAVLIAVYTVMDGIAARLASSATNYAVWILFLQGFPICAYMFFLRGKPALQILKNRAWQLSFGGFMSMTGYMIVLWAMTQAPIALIAAFRESSIIIAALIGMFWMKEPGGWRRIFAAVLIFLSVVYLKIA